MMIHIAPYISFLILFALMLSLRVIKLRRKLQIGVGTGGNPELALAIGVQSNFMEYTALAMPLLIALLLAGAPAWALHSYGLLFCAGRVLHFLGYGKFAGLSKGRVWGMYCTFWFFALAAGNLLYLAAGGALGL